MVVIYCTERDNDKVLKSYMIKSCFFEKKHFLHLSAVGTFKDYKCRTFKELKLNKQKGCAFLLVEAIPSSASLYMV